MAAKRARTKSGHFVSDDPSTPENEAYVNSTPVVSPSTRAKQKRAPKNEEQSKFVMFVSTNEEPSAFDLRVAESVISGTWDVAREFVHWKVPREQVPNLMKHHHIFTGRIIPAEDI